MESRASEPAGEGAFPANLAKAARSSDARIAGISARRFVFASTFGGCNQES